MAVIQPDRARMIELKEEHGLIGARSIALREALIKRCQDLPRSDREVAEILETIISLMKF